MKKRNITAKRIWNWATTLFVALIVAAAVLTAGARVVGFRIFTVLSGSMEPSYPVGSLVYVKRVDPQKLKTGQVITFLLDADTVATHRITEVVRDESDPPVLRFRTKGDANAVEDGGLVHYKNVIGTPVLTIPLLGYVISYIQHPPGIYVAVSVGAALLLLVILPDLFGPEREVTLPRGGNQDETCD